MDMVAPTSAEVRAELPAVSIGGDGGWWRERMPIDKRAVNLIGVVQNGDGPAGALQREEAVPQETQRRMVMEAWPRATLEVVQAEFLLELLIALLYLPARFPDADCFLQRGRRR